jgi:hypothetical protein
MPVDKAQEDEHTCCCRQGLSMELTEEEHEEQNCNLGFTARFDIGPEMPVTEWQEEEHTCC